MGNSICPGPFVNTVIYDIQLIGPLQDNRAREYSPLAGFKRMLMKVIQNVFISILAITLISCSAPSVKHRSDISNNGQREILNVLPKNIEGFTYDGVRTYPEPLGYSLVYRLDGSRLTYSDIYVYPVPGKMSGHTHKQIIDDMSNQALMEIAYAKEKGLYTEFKIINSKTFNLDGNYVNKVAIYVVKDNVESFSLLYLTQCEGKILKVRMTMPDNEINRHSDRWQKFVEKVFSVIIANIDKA